MATLFHVTVRNDEDEIFEFESTQPVVHLDIPAGRYVITVRCAASPEQAVSPELLHVAALSRKSCRSARGPIRKMMARALMRYAPRSWGVRAAGR